MISNELEEIIELLKNQGEMIFLECATDDQIYQFEKNNKIRFPLKYKEWLKFSDGGECFLPAGIQLYGVSHKPLIDAKDTDRPNDNYTIIGALSTGDPILCEKDNEVISIYNREANKIEKDEIYPDFFSFLKDLHNLLGIGE